MPRDRSKNVYVTIGIPRDSATYAALLADSAETGLSPAQVIATRIADWYRQSSGSMREAACQTASSHQVSSSVNEVDTATLDLQQRAAQAVAAWTSIDEE